MADLSVDFAGVKLKNPVILASATPGWDGLHMKEAALAGAGAVIPKTIGPVQSWAAHPRNGRMHLVRVGNKPIGMINMELFTTKTREEWINKELAIAREGGAKIFASILAMPEPEETAQLLAEVQEAGMADLFELNVSCPMPASTVGMHIGKSATLTYEQVKAAKSVARLPLIIKLTPNVSDMTDIALAAQEAGVDGITISNSVRSFSGVDIETGRPWLRGYGGYSGPAIRPIVMRHLSEVAKVTKVPLAAVGGVTSWRDVVEYIMLGATVVELATAVMWEGFRKITSVIEGLNEFLDNKGYKSFEDFRGISLPYITTVEKLAEEPIKYANIDQDKCTICATCQRVCMYGAVQKDEIHMWVNEAACDGCGLCVQWCPVGAIALR